MSFRSTLVSRRSILVIAVGAALASTDLCRAGGALYYDVAGAPVVWPVTGPVDYWTDQGGLGVLDNASALGLVADSFGRWESVATAVIAYQNAGSLGLDVDETNFGSYLGPFGGVTTPLGLSPIVFDADGSIFDAIYGVGTSVVGFASPTFFSDGSVTVELGASLPAGSWIIEGLAFLNGRMIDGVTGATNPEITLPEFEAVFVHEFGHFSSLDHTQIHGLLPSYYPTPGCCDGPVETMFPFLTTEGQSSLERDDVVALSSLYPASGFSSSTGCVQGEVRSEVGDPVPGANVIAANTVSSADSISAISGANLVAAAAYRICGLTPGQEYTVRVEEVDAFHSGGSSVGPFSFPVPLPGPPEYYNGSWESHLPSTDDPADFVPVSAGPGETVTLADIVLNRQAFSLHNHEIMTPFGGPVDFGSGDFDGDDDLDLIAVGPATGVTFHRNTGAGELAPPVTLAPFELSNFAVAVGQYNPGVDDDLDFAVANFRKGNVEVYWGDGAGGFSAPVPLLPARAPSIYTTRFARGSFNGDAYTDLVLLLVEPADGSTTVSTLLGSATGSFTLVPSSIPTATGFTFNSDTAIVAGQLAAGATDDLLVGAVFANIPSTLWILQSDGAGGFVPFEAELLGLSEIPSRFFAAGHLDGDARLDLVMPGGAGVRLLRGLGNRRFLQVAELEASNASVYGLAVEDFNGDSVMDIAAAGNYLGAGEPGARVDVFLGNGNAGVLGTYVVHGLVEFPALDTPSAVEAVDLSGEGHSDLVVSNKPVSLLGLTYPATFSVLLEQDLPVCAADPVLAIANELITVNRTYVACRTIRAGPDVVVAPGIEVTFLAGQLVSLGNGFQVRAGALFTATADPGAVLE